MRLGWMRIGLLLALGAGFSCGSGDDSGNDVSDATDTVDVGADADEDVAADADADGDAPIETGEDGAAETTDGSETVSTNVPICEGGTGSGTRRRWADPVSGFIYCEATCRDCEAVCREDGTYSEGWYAQCTDPGTDGGCGTVPGLIGYANCM